MQYTNSDKTPLYKQLKNYILKKIRSGEWQEGDTLPTEIELQKISNMSRVTVRHAIEELEYEGYVIKRQGRGTYVSAKKLQYLLPKLTSFTEDMAQKGLKAGSKTLRLDIIMDPDVAEKMDLPSNSKLLMIHRIRTVDDIILGAHFAYFNLSMLNEARIMSQISDNVLLDMLDKQSRSFYDILQNEHDIFIQYADENIEAVACSSQLSPILGVKSGSPLLYLERKSFTVRNEVVEFVKMYNRADIYKYSLRLTR